jgi:hypothetical protein
MGFLLQTVDVGNRSGWPLAGAVRLLLRTRGGQEILAGQTPKAVEESSAIGTKRFRRQGGGFVGAVGFTE